MFIYTSFSICIRFVWNFVHIFIAKPLKQCAVPHIKVYHIKTSIFSLALTWRRKKNRRICRRKAIFSQQFCEIEINFRKLNYERSWWPGKPFPGIYTILILWRKEKTNIVIVSILTFCELMKWNSIEFIDMCTHLRSNETSRFPYRSSGDEEAKWKQKWMLWSRHSIYLHAEIFSMLAQECKWLVLYHLVWLQLPL